MSGLKLPPYVLEHIFDSQKAKVEVAYQRRQANEILCIPHHAPEINVNFVHLIVEERTHQENIRLFIAVQKAQQRKE